MHTLFTPANQIPANQIPAADEVGTDRRRPLWLAAVAVPLLAGAAAFLWSARSAEEPAPASPIASATAAPATAMRPTTPTTAGLSPLTTVAPAGWTTTPEGGSSGATVDTTPPAWPGTEEPAPAEPAAEEPPAPQPGVLSTASSVQVGTTGKGTLTLVNDGGTAISWALAGPATVSFAQTEGTLEPGATAKVAVTVSLAGRPTGPFSELVDVLSSGGDAAISLDGNVLGFVNPPTTAKPLGLAPKK